MQTQQQFYEIDFFFSSSLEASSQEATWEHSQTLQLSFCVKEAQGLNNSYSFISIEILQHYSEIANSRGIKERQYLHKIPSIC